MKTSLHLPEKVRATHKEMSSDIPRRICSQVSACFPGHGLPHNLSAFNISGYLTTELPSVSQLQIHLIRKARKCLTMNDKFAQLQCYSGGQLCQESETNIILMFYSYNSLRSRACHPTAGITSTCPQTEYLYFPPSSHLVYLCFCPVAFRCYNKIINRYCGC